MIEAFTTWCAGLPLVERRPLGDEERTHLSREARALRWRWVAAWILFPPSLFAALAALAIAEPTPGPQWDAVMPAGILGSLILLGLVATLGRESRRHSRGLFGDLRTGHVLRFEGELGELDPEDETQAAVLGGDPSVRPRSAPGYRPPPLGPQTLEVLPVSRRIWRVNGRPPNRWLTATWTETAAAAHESLTAGPLPLDGELDWETAARVQQRALSAAEREELRRHIRRTWRRPLWLTVGLSVWFWPLFTICLHTGRWPSGFSLVSFAHLGVGAAALDLHLLLSLWQALQHRRDLKAGRLDVVNLDTEEGPGEVVELLPISRRQWSHRGKPAPWRTKQAW